MSGEKGRFRFLSVVTAENSWASGRPYIHDYRATEERLDEEKQE